MTSALLIQYIVHYGYPGLFAILGISILGLPVPDEFLMTFVGFLSFSGQLNSFVAIISAAAGSMTGITIAYFLGRFFEERVLVHLKKHTGSNRLEKVFQWYHRHGGKLLTIGYFIPGVRHLSGYIAGLSHLSYRDFAFHAYLGAIAWASTFITLGKVLGSEWETILPIIHRYALLLGVTLTVLVLTFYLLFKNHERWSAWLIIKRFELLNRYLTLGKRRIFVTVGGVLFVVLFILLMGLIQDFMAHELGAFDELVSGGLQQISFPFGGRLMAFMNFLGSYSIVFLVFVLTLVLLWLLNKTWSHSLPFSLAWVGGGVIERLFHLIFREERVSFLLAALAFYAVLGYVLATKAVKPSLLAHTLILVGTVLFLVLMALSPIYLNVHAPSTMVTALVVSGLWALISVFVYEYWLFTLEKTDVM